MNIIKWVVLLSSLQVLVGCASGRTPVTGTEGLGKAGAAITRADVDESLAQDADKDGIPDSEDECADSSSTALVDATGCEIVTGVIEGLNFGPDKTELSSDSRAALSKLVEALLRYPEVVIAVEGHTDNRGAAADNLELSKQRVLSVVRYMVSQGITADRIKPYGYGESRPRAANATAIGREQNRRIEINIVEGLL
ncbi:OmpA family protein [Granulosicoccus antarcticus]|uniref:Outer membrane porin F n=1 Tax=Granulosicoccus antarcticus IMCC3135 TaxID=1192854 RepID=A0A2Z2NV00_9GAMM|nr:OmpA family protein [Granulosicoccus antarcticus]ASJ75296.1 Outer membrane porin F [Granulosicoccus antarcticus IMCC3135]